MKRTALLISMIALAFDAKSDTVQTRPFSLKGYLQVQNVRVARAGAPAANTDEFLVRRAELTSQFASGKIARAVLSADFSSSVAIKDAFVEVAVPLPRHDVRFTGGQFNLPFGFEIGYSSSARELPERSRIVRTLFPGERDRGAMIAGDAAAGRLKYQFAVVNGNGMGKTSAADDGKDVVGRLGFSSGRATLGVSGYRGTEKISHSVTAVPKERAGVDFQIEAPRGFRIRGEYIRARDKGAHLAGGYVYLIKNFGTRHAVVLRADDYQHLDGTSSLPASAIADGRTLGVSYVLRWAEAVTVMAAYERCTCRANAAADSTATIRLQYKFSDRPRMP